MRDVPAVEASVKSEVRGQQLDMGSGASHRNRSRRHVLRACSQSEAGVIAQSYG